jgi:hypothetical protein
MTYVLTLSDLENSQAFFQNIEQLDKTSLAIMFEASLSVQPQLMQWAKAGFPPLFAVKSTELRHPFTCSDGQTRNLNDYVTYLMGSDLMTLTSQFQSNFLDLQFSYSTTGNTVTLHVSKA